MAIHLARCGHKVVLVPRRKEAADAMAVSRENKEHLAGIKLDAAIEITQDFALHFPSIDVLILATPAKGMRDCLLKIKPYLPEAKSLKLMLSLCKGLEKNSLKSATGIVQEVLGAVNWGVLSGPSYAKEVAQGKPTALVMASHAPLSMVQKVQEGISNETLRVYRSLDLIGTELGGCLKNVYAIGAGICDGLHLGVNAKAAYLTRALHEMTRLGSGLGGQVATFYGLSGFGDLVATSQGLWSRNRNLGQKIAEGSTPQEVVETGNSAVEGFWACECFHAIAQQKSIDCPILNELFLALFKQKSPKLCVSALMTRELKQEQCIL